MSGPLDFSRLSLMDALDLASLIEEEAQERYLELANQMEVHHTGEAAEFFRFMAVNEERHGTELSTRRRGLFGDAPRHVSRSMLWEEEAPGYETVTAFMSARQAMEVARESERKAQKFFEAALPHVSDSDVRALFQELFEEEIHHQKLVEGAMSSLPPEPAARAEEFADEPVAQG